MTERTQPSWHRLGLGTLMVLVAGIGIGLWFVMEDVSETLREPFPDMGFNPHQSRWDAAGFTVLIGVLGGLSAVGVPLLLTGAWRRTLPRQWGPGRVLWFASGTASWLLWPPVIVRRLQGQGASVGHTHLGVCWAYGTPLMALYVTITLLAGGWIRRRRRALPWPERFGLVLGLLWAVTGLYLLTQFYRGDLSKR